MVQLVKECRAFGGLLQQYEHLSSSTKTVMQFSVFLPPTASETNKVPVLIYLPGACEYDECLFLKAPNAMKAAAARGIALVSPDTSPRGCNIPGEEDDWAFGTGAGFFVDATEPLWKENYNMYTYVTEELPTLLKNLPVQVDRRSITGHSMGGHGALMIAQRCPDQYRSVSALAPVTHATKAPIGIVAFTGYLGPDVGQWAKYDATLLMLEKGPQFKEILIDQGTEDGNLPQGQLLPEAFEAACKKVGQKLTLRNQEGYDHFFSFVATFIEDHVNFHADALLQE